jgi:hypothetical protein
MQVRQLAAVFYPFGHATPYAYALEQMETLCLIEDRLGMHSVGRGSLILG